MVGTILFIGYIKQTIKIYIYYRFNRTPYYKNLYKVYCSPHAYSRWSLITNPENICSRMIYTYFSCRKRFILDIFQLLIVICVTSTIMREHDSAATFNRSKEYSQWHFYCRSNIRLLKKFTTLRKTFLYLWSVCGRFGLRCSPTESEPTTVHRGLRMGRQRAGNLVVV